jgi:hypothetical protein
VSYIWDGNSWETLAKDGNDGMHGVAGATGATGAKGDKGDKGDQGEPAPMLVLIPKTGEPDWEIIDGQTGGVLMYSPMGDEFGYCLQAYGLTPSTGYSLIYYADPWSGTGGCLIASGTSDASGILFLVGEHDIGMSIPVATDDNHPTGGKIWLVLSSDYDAVSGGMTAWQPTEYLFEYALITYIDTNG